MSSLIGFKPFNFSEGVPSLSITKNGLTFNKSCIIKLNYANYVLLLINEDEKKLAIQQCDKSTPNSVSFYKEGKQTNNMLVRWNSQDLRNTISKITGWTLDFDIHRATGELIKDENAIIFDLTKATVS